MEKSLKEKLIDDLESVRKNLLNIYLPEDSEIIWDLNAVINNIDAAILKLRVIKL